MPYCLQAKMSVEVPGEADRWDMSGYSKAKSMNI